MATIDYKEKYMQALERARQFSEKPYLEDSAGIVEYIFPELKESEDEKIRKALINGFNKLDKSVVWYNGITNGQILDWIEKQGENSVCKVKIGETYKCIASPRYTCFRMGDVYQVKDNFVAKLINICSDCFVLLEKQGEQKPVDKVEPKFKIGDRIISIISNIPYCITKVCDGYYATDTGCDIMFNAQDNFKLYEHKPAWSKDDDDVMINKLLAVVNLYYDRSGNDLDKQSCISFLKSLKDRVQPQPRQKWSEEDEARFKSCIKILQTSDGYDTINAKWLKSLRPQKRDWSKEDEEMFAIISDLLWEGYKESGGTPTWDKIRNWFRANYYQSQWKPSEEQMNALNYVINLMASSERPIDNDLRYNILKSLRQQLKRLMEK